jgi:hypothetical protein
MGRSYRIVLELEPTFNILAKGTNINDVRLFGVIFDPCLHKIPIYARSLSFQIKVALNFCF